MCYFHGQINRKGMEVGEMTEKGISRTARFVVLMIAALGLGGAWIGIKDILGLGLITYAFGAVGIAAALVLMLGD